MKSGGPFRMRFALFWFFFILFFPLPGEADFAYTVQPGESIFRIAKRFQATVSRLQGANGPGDEKIYLGQGLVIPAASPKAEIQPSVKESEEEWVGNSALPGE